MFLLFLLPAFCLGQLITIKPDTMIVPDTDKMIEDIFKVLDMSKDDKLVIDELHAFFMKMDVDSNGEVTHHEFIMLIEKDLPTLKAVSYDLYMLVDINHDHHVKEMDYDHLFNLADINDDKEVTKDEFKKFMMKLWMAIKS